MRLSTRIQGIEASGIRRVFDLARSLKDPIDFSIGQPDFDVPEAIKDRAVEAIRAGKNRYTPTQGIAPLQDQVITEEHAATGRTWKRSEVLITSGVSGGLFLALAALVEPGDEVLIPDPYFVMYTQLVRFFGGVPVFIDTYADGFSLDPAKVRAAITPKTKLLLLNSPANPTGRILPADCLKSLAQVCESAGVQVISDEIYRRFSYVPMTSIAQFLPSTLVLGGWGKTYGMTGWRMGFAAGPEALIQAMARLQQFSFVCAPSFAQEACLACPNVDVSARLDHYRAKRDLMVQRLSGSFRLGSPDGAFYLFVEAPPGWTGDAFAEHCIKNSVLVIPGSVFSQRKSHFRVCYTVTDERLAQGADKLCALAKQAPPA